MFKTSSILYGFFVITILKRCSEQQQPQSQQTQINVNLYNANASTSLRSRAQNCLRGDCYPETGDLLIGRTKFLHASSTCGLTQPERYCVLGTTRDATKCFVCDSSEPYDPVRNTNSHTIENIVSRKQGDRFNRWWQSENGKQDVFIQFDLEAEFAFTHIIMTFKTFRPAAMIIEKSSDFGRTWKTYGYFASSCSESFPGIGTELPKNLGDVYCESKYSSETPSTKGEVVFRILPPTLIQSKDPYSVEIQELLKITNLRINFTKLHTFGDNLLDPREDLKEKYYYSLYEMVVRGSCLCYGHASRCIPVEGVQYDVDKNGMVDGQCQCQHNTWGTNCEKCLPLFNDRPWQPARSGHANECKKCQCHNHARSCHFDQELYISTNMTTGGVCDDCQHNTEGNNCEKCKEDFWRDPRKPIDDIFTCRPCNCDKSGSLNDAKCDPHTDEEAGLVAGKCHCKELVEGEHCDRCKNGYFNLTKENPVGCEPCSCNLIGTTGNLGCDKISGLCECKQFVTGRACDQCMPGYFGLSEDDPNGCKPCDCSLGGSYGANCDVITGQCSCKPNMVGRTCEKPENGFYCPTLDHLLYEAEEASKLNERVQDYIRPFSLDYKPTWTGVGFVRVFEGASLEFMVDNIYKAGYYELIIRYENQQSESWEDLRISIIRLDGPPDYSDVCSDFIPQDDDKIVSLPSGRIYQTVLPPSCLERQKKYKIKLEFVRFGSNVPSRDASILIDSIVLVPTIEDLPALQGNNSENLMEEFRYHRCKDAQLNIYKDEISPNCAKFICNIGIHNDYALPCDCNPTGSISNICEEFGGMCKCKQNVIGQKCDKCAPGTWEFGPNGCQPCNCNSAGAKNNFCDLETSQCDCYERIEGLKCDTCMDNYWRFPSCEPCNCNGFADTCNKTTGICINCRDNTVGYNCENCKEGYYGRPTAGQPCKECMCPGGAGANQFASSCYFDPRLDGVVCDCEEGYIGAKCERCAPHYFGNPTVKGGSCTKCTCNGNVDMNDPYTCDQATGKCLNCLYNTDGDHCEKCKPGYYGNASNHECRPCNCNPEGTEDNSALNCDQVTGQCICLPNVIGRYCDQCKPDHYGISSREGCTYCNCDTDGTYDNSTSCDIVTGQCNCLPSRGGKTCSDCSYGYWGDPNNECKKCECFGEGSLSDQCDKINGSCTCKVGIRGHNCDTCDRGTTGNVPFCKPCGDCFNDWNDIITDLKDELETIEEKASNLAVASSSSVKDFTAEYTLLEEKLSDIRKIIPLNYTDRQLKQLNDQLQNINKQMESKKKSREKFYDIEKWTQDNPETKLNTMKEKFSGITLETDELTKTAMDLKESHEQGAIDSINKANKISHEASQLLDTVDSKLNTEFKPILDKLQQKLDSSKDKLEKSDAELDEYFESILANLTMSSSGIFGLNQAVCGDVTSETQKCSDKCGGALCDGKCGSNSSSCSSLMDSYNSLVNSRKKFEDLFGAHELVFKRILTKLINSTNLLNNTNKEVNNLMEHTNKSLESIDTKQKDISNLITKLDNFTDMYKEKPNVIEENCGFAADLTLNQKDEDLDSTLGKIGDLASKISVEQIGTELDEKLAAAQDLLKKSDQAAVDLNDLTAKLNRTSETLNQETNKTDHVENAFSEFKENNVNFVNNLSNTKENLAKTEKTVQKLEKHLGDLNNSIDLNSIKDKTAKILSKQDSFKSKVKESGVTLERTKNNLETLKVKVEELTKKFQSFIKIKDNEKDSNLLDTLISLQSSIINKQEMINQKANKIKKLEKNYEETRTRINELKSVIYTLKQKAINIKSDIQSKESYFNTCS